MNNQLTRINTNIGAMQTLKALNDINGRLANHQLRLSTGQRINSAEDDAAGWVIGKTLEARTRGLSVAINNVGDAKNVISIAESGLDSLLDILMEMKAKITQAASDTLSTAERAAIEKKLAELASEVDAVVTQTQFDGNTLIDGTYTSKTIQVGAETTDVLDLSISQNHNATATAVADADLASEQIEAVKLQILQQTATSALAQANSSPRAVLMLFR